MEIKNYTEGDVFLFQSLDDGEIIVEGGLMEMDEGLRTSVYLATFGGNENDSGAENDPNEWWGNKMETDPDFKYRAETQYAIGKLTPSSVNLGKLEDAAVRDCQYLINKGYATSVTAVATIPELNKVKLDIIIVTLDGVEKTFNFTETWSS
jgi:phage gp46-like protein